MDFKLTEEQQMLQDTAARLVRDVYTFEKRLEFSASDAGFSTDFWQQLGELGLTAIPFAEELGGVCGTGAQRRSSMERLDRGVCVEPHAESVILTRGLIGALGCEQHKEGRLSAIPSGGLHAVVALDEPSGHYDLCDGQTM